MVATLTSIRIRNLALVEELDWHPGSGFIAITGETGSGKSIIIGALKLLIGERADKSLIRTGAESCSVEATFQMHDSTLLDRQLEEFGLEPCSEGELILKRVFSSTGTNRQFVNCGATTLAVLKEIGNALVDLHGPHDHQSLLSSDKQLDLLDSYAGAADLRTQYESKFREQQSLESEYDELSTSEASLEREVDLLRHQVQEIESAELVADEEESLLARYSVATNSRRLIEISTAIVQRLAEADDALLPRHAEVQRLLRDLERVDPAQAETARAHAEAVGALEDVAQSLQRYLNDLDVDPEQMQQLEARVSLVETLKRKYGATIPDVIAFGEQAAARLHKIESRGDELLRLEKAIESARESVQKTGSQLSAKRSKAAPKLAASIQSQLRDLGFKKSEFAVDLLPLPAPALCGMEKVEFRFAPNPGEPMKPLKATASSGEISRVMLAVKSSLAAQDEVALLVFDEIDANVGGEIAHSVAAKMRSLGEQHQVLCITHLPQVAAAATSQFVVRKEYVHGRTLSSLTAVEGTAREEEISRMLGGKGDSAMAHARSLLGLK